MQSSFEKITPERAIQYLRANKSNRPIRKTLVDQYSRDIKNGRWEITHQGIAFSDDGLLIDGQHRLQAVVDAGTPVHMLVTRGVSRSSQLVVDDHAKRSASDALTLSMGEHISNFKVAVVRAAVEILKNNRSEKKTKQEMIDLIKTFTGALCFIEGFQGEKQRGVSSAPVWGAVALAWFYVHDLERLSAFCKILKGQEMAKGEKDRAAQILREFLLREGACRYAEQRTEVFKKTQRAIAAFVVGEPISRLYATAAYFHWPLHGNIRN